MNLIRMIYTSSIADRTDSAALEQILQTARANNDRHDLTGLLVFSSKHYLQVIEGGNLAVNRLLANLYRDPRHLDMRLLGMDEIRQRAFPDWSMQFVPAASATRQILLRHSISREFAPHYMSYQSALGFLADMRTLSQPGGAASNNATPV